MKLLSVLHKKPAADGTGRRLYLGLYEHHDGSHVYGVEDGRGKILFLGTKAEAKRYYGNRRREP